MVDLLDVMINETGDLSFYGWFRQTTINSTTLLQFSLVLSFVSIIWGLSLNNPMIVKMHLKDISFYMKVFKIFSHLETKQKIM